MRAGELLHLARRGRGRPAAPHRLGGGHLLPKRLALPIFSSDALSSVT